MARLTRTQKYADLREQLSQDSESSIKAENAGQYVDKIKTLENYFNTATTADDLTTNTAYVPPVFSDEAKRRLEEEEAKKAQEARMKIFDDIFNSVMNSFDEEKNNLNENAAISQQEQVETQVEIEEVKPVEIKVEPKEEIIEQVVEEPKQEVKEEIKKETASEAAPVNNETNVIETISTEATQIGDIIDDINDQVGVPAPIKPEVKEEVVKEVEEESSGVKEAKDISSNIDSKLEMLNGSLKEVVDKAYAEKEVGIDLSNNDFINNTLKEVDDFNKKVGQKTIENLTESMINEVIHNQEQVENVVEKEPIKEEPQVVEAPANKEDKSMLDEMSSKEFSDTVSLKINEVLQEINATNEAATIDMPKAEPAPVKTADDEFKEAFKRAEENFKEVENEPDVDLSTPVVEIKNITETLQMPINDMIDDTIPFTVEQQEEEEVEEQEESTSPVLNIILGVLIFVLLAVLAVIVYYILVARGIIE